MVVPLQIIGQSSGLMKALASSIVILISPDCKILFIIEIGVVSCLLSCLVRKKQPLLNFIYPWVAVNHI